MFFTTTVYVYKPNRTGQWKKVKYYQSLGINFTQNIPCTGSIYIFVDYKNAFQIHERILISIRKPPCLTYK